MLDHLKKYNIILASKSPRRKELLKGLNIDFKVFTYDVKEVYPNNMEITEIPKYLSEIKAAPFTDKVENDTIVITSDTIVHINGNVLGKPESKQDAFKMISSLSGKKHTVTSGVCILFKGIKKSFTVSTNVWFTKLGKDEINYYIEHYHPLDKAGAYGIQEWIGFIGIDKIEGSYYNVMGLPLQKLYQELKMIEN